MIFRGRKSSLGEHRESTMRAGVRISPVSGLSPTPACPAKITGLPHCHPSLRDVHLLGDDDGGGQKESGSGNGQEPHQRFTVTKRARLRALFTSVPYDSGKSAILTISDGEAPHAVISSEYSIPNK